MVVPHYLYTNLYVLNSLKYCDYKVTTVCGEMK
jgi:hypothetical protein